MIIWGFKKSCKFWLESESMFDEKKKGDFTDSELKEIRILIYKNKEILINQFFLFYNNHVVKATRK